MKFLQRWKAFWTRPWITSEIEEEQISFSDYIFKLVLIGDHGIGKSSILLRLTTDLFTADKCGRTPIDLHTHTIQFGGKTIQLEIWGLTGPLDCYKSIREDLYKEAHGILIAYDSTNEESFKNVRHWIDEVNQYAKKKATLLVIGNKCDAVNKRAVDTQTAEAFVNEIGVSLVETSAKDGSGVETAFVTVASKIMNRMACELALGKMSGIRRTYRVKSWRS